MCFDLSTKAACASTTLHRAVRVNSMINVTSYPVSTRAIGDPCHRHGPSGSERSRRSAASTPRTNATCAGIWPIADRQALCGCGNGAPFPKPRPPARIQSFCLPAAAAPRATTWPAPRSRRRRDAGRASLPTYRLQRSGSFVLDPRVYLPARIDTPVLCYNASTDASCVNFPKATQNASLRLHRQSRPGSGRRASGQRRQRLVPRSRTSTPSPAQACGQGAIRVLASQFVVDQVQLPAGVVHVAGDPRRLRGRAYTDGTVAFQDADAQPIPGIPDKPLDAHGKIDLSVAEPVHRAWDCRSSWSASTACPVTPREVVVRSPDPRRRPACAPSGAPSVTRART